MGMKTDYCKRIDWQC